MALSYTPGPRSRAAAIAVNALQGATPWVASTAYPAGQVLTNAGSAYSVNVAFTTPATFNTTGLTLLAGVGATGAAAPLFVGTITGDGVASSYTVTHNLNTTNLVCQLHDPSDNGAIIVGVDVTFPTANTALVIFGAPLTNAAAVTVVLH